MQIVPDLHSNVELTAFISGVCLCTKPEWPAGIDKHDSTSFHIHTHTPYDMELIVDEHTAKGKLPAISQSLLERVDFHIKIMCATQCSLWTDYIRWKYTCDISVHDPNMVCLWLD